MKLKITVVEAKEGVRTIVNGDNPGANTLPVGAEVEIEAATLELRELGLPSGTGDAPGANLGD